MTHVPFKGAGPALAAAMANEVQIVIDPLATAKKFSESGKLRALAVTTGKRSELWPEMPTVAEGGLKNFDTGVWYGVYVAGKTAPAVVQLLNSEFVHILKTPEMVAWLRDQGLQPIADKPEESRAWLAKEIRTWKTVANAAGIKPE
jgi:tripartite-type tricarboxylate transporter receptor subunit TctC